MKNKQRIIISAYLEGKTQREIADEIGISRATVITYLKKYEEARQKLFLEGRIAGDPKELIDKIVEEPKYNSNNREKRKATKEIINKIVEYLQENEHKKRIGQAKQQKKRIDIYEALKNEGYDISYGTVRNIINELQQRGKEAFIKAEYDLGDICEFDWGEVKIFINGELKKFQLAVFTSAKGNFRYAILFLRQDTFCFQEAHAIFFEKIGGVYRTMVYDNTRVVIKKFVGRNEKEPTEGLLKLSIYYGFRFRFCNMNAGHEKGHVERSVEYIRRKAFAFRDRFDSIEEANLYLESVCNRLNSIPQKLNDNQTANEIFATEKAWLLPKTPVFDTAKTIDARVDKYSTIAVDTCRYSVPDFLVGKMVFVKAYGKEIICFYDGQKIAEHERKYGFNEWSIKIEHYVDTLKKKPGALNSSVALHQANPRLQEIYRNYYIKKEKEFIELLQFMREKGLAKIEEAIKMLERISPIDISTEKIKTICNRNVLEKPKTTSESEITAQSKAMLIQFKNLIPASNEDFAKEVAII